MTQSGIEWTDRSDWNPLRGCTRISTGCVNCYAENIAGRFSGPGLPFAGYATKKGKEARWTGKVAWQYDRFDLPLRWRKPVKIFPSSTSDIFHENLPAIEIAELFGVMIAAHHLRGHIFQPLTKRANLMNAYLNRQDFWEHANIEAGRHVMEWTDPLDRRSDDARATLRDYDPENPPPGIWLGVSTEDQAALDDRWPHLRDTPAAVRWISAEPLLGPLDLEMDDDGPLNGAEPAKAQIDAPRGLHYLRHGAPRVDWIVAGGESGPGARGSCAEVEIWMRAILAQCRRAGVPFFGKQNFKKLPLPDDLMVREFPG